MFYVKWVIRLVCFAIVGLFLLYTLPQRDIVRVTDNEIIRKDFSGWTRIFYAQADSGDAETVNRDLRLIYAVRANGRQSIYRNEDTGFGWPPYFKLDSSNLQAQASDSISSLEEPKWYVLRHYGWRSPLLSIYPNAISMKPAPGPNWSDFSLWQRIPLFNITVILFLFAVYWGVGVRIQRFREKRIDPLFDGE